MDRVPYPPSTYPTEGRDEAFIDQAIEESFPASDPPSITPPERRERAEPALPVTGPDDPDRV